MSPSQQKIGTPRDAGLCLIMSERAPERPRKAVLADWLRALENTQRRRDNPISLPALIQIVAEQRGSELALIGPRQQLTYADLAARARCYTRWALAQQLQAGETVCLLMLNEPDYVAIWLGLTHIGCVVALLNTHLGGDALVHGISSAAATHVIASGSLMNAVYAARGQLPRVRTWWTHGPGCATTALPRIDAAVRCHDVRPLDNDEQRPPAMHDPALLIYTSGTTGLPKAAIVTHARIMEWSDWFAGLMDARPSDRLYDCLPMYHSVGGVVAIGSMLVSGGSVVIRQRFSAAAFWNDVAGTESTIVQYIGELCRYLVRTEPTAGEAHHRVRLFCGNGLRGEIWPLLQHRFHISRILEYYAATEGGVSLYNCEGKPGAIGRVPSFLAHRFSVELIRCDPETGHPMRGKDGYCQRCPADESGEAVGQLGGAASRRFDGYTDTSASQQKVLLDVFERGDSWFRTGDLMRRDAAGFYYFVDRMGDTFRWKGENVSTAEVATVLGACPGVVEVVVYGVAVPGTEGRAGMAAVVADETFFLPQFRTYVHENLPDFARPLFIRLCTRIATTGTFKLQKTELAREGYSSAGSDLVWFDDRMSGRFVECNAALVRQLGACAVKL